MTGNAKKANPEETEQVVAIFENYDPGINRD
jgi:hypothetical protein